ncbi:MAG TPA: hypothetical protein VIH78_11795 [Terriglobales bacterium]
MSAIDDNRKAITSLLARQSYIETKIAEWTAIGRSSYAMANEHVAIDFAVAALEFVIQTIEYESAQIPRCT